jgi:hypothetical protein
VMALLAASPASFQPSKAAISAGEVSLPTASSSIASHLLSSASAQDRLTADGHWPGQLGQAYVP